MFMPDKLTLFYTQHIAGDLALLPHLYTFMQALRPQYAAHPLIVDLGDSCQPDVWPCDVTGGRATLVVLDGMGYHAANVDNLLEAGSRQRLKNVISTAMIDANNLWRYDVPPERDEGIIVSLQPTPAMRLNIALAAADQTQLAGKTLHLQAVRKAQVGVVQVDLQRDDPRLALHEVFTLPSGLKPAPTISAAVELVEDEARFLQKRNS